MPRRTRYVFALLAALSAAPLPIAALSAPAQAAVASDVPSAQALQAIKLRFDQEIDRERKKMGVAVLERKYPLPGAVVRVNTGEEAITYEVTLARPVSRQAAQQVASALFKAFDEKVAIDFAKTYKVTRQSVLYVFTYDAKTTQAGPKDDPQGAGCSVELFLDKAGRVTRVTYISGS
jgi:hypothetical protein